MSDEEYAAPYQVRAMNGADLLDKINFNHPHSWFNHPHGWADRIDLEKFHISHFYCCVLPSLYGSYDKWANFPPTLDLIMFGFDIESEASDADVAALQEAWLYEILRRCTPPPPPLRGFPKLLTMLRDIRHPRGHKS